MRCTGCTQEFVISTDEAELRSRLAPSIDGEREEFPRPLRCPDCRQQLRLAFRNERTLYTRKCSRTGEKLLSMYGPNTPFPVYANSVWWSGEWNARDYGREIDFTRPFFEQFAELAATVPKAALNAANNENCDYVNYVMDCKDCYLLLRWGERSEHCLYGKLVIDCRDCIDVTQAIKSELCYECIDIENCYHLLFSQNCKQCSDSYFLRNCVGCSECFGCINLHNKRFCIFNRQHSAAEYLEAVNRLCGQLRSVRGFAEIQDEFERICETAPHKYYQGSSIEDCSGDALRNCRSVHSSFSVTESEYGFHLFDCVEVSHCIDLSIAGKNGTAYSYNCLSYTGNRCAFVNLVWLCSDLLYCQECFHGTHDCFGSIGLVKREYCILNTQYSREEYFRLCKWLIAHMRETGEWGEYFPPALSPFGYNETVAHEYVPLNPESAKRLGFRWAADIHPGATHRDPTAQICTASGRQFRLTADERKFYTREGLAEPHLHPDERHKLRLAKRNPRKLYSRSCAECAAHLESIIEPSRPERVYCESCFLALVV